MLGQSRMSYLDVFLGDLRSNPTSFQKMGDLRRRPATHKTVVNEVALVRPRRDLVLDQLLWKDRRMLKCYLVSRRRSTDIVRENVIHLSLFRRDMIVCKIVAADLCYPKRLESFLLFDRLHEGIERFWLALAKAKHVFETLPVSFAAIARDRIVLVIDHRIVNLESRFLKRERVTKACQRLVAV